MSSYLILADLEGIYGVEDLNDIPRNKDLLLAQLKRTIDCIKTIKDSVVKVCLIHGDGQMDVEGDILNLGANYYGGGIKSILNPKSAADYAILIGFHSKTAGAGVFPHSFKPEIERVITDDKEIGEVYLFSKFFKLHGTKVLFVSGEGFFDDEIVFEGTKTHYISSAVNYEDALLSALNADSSEVKSFVTDDEIQLYLNNSDYYGLIDSALYSKERKCYVFASVQNFFENIIDLCIEINRTSAIIRRTNLAFAKEISRLVKSGQAEMPDIELLNKDIFLFNEFEREMVMNLLKTATK